MPGCGARSAAPRGSRVSRSAGVGLVLAYLAVVPGCRKDREMAEQLEMPDSTEIMEALTNRAMQDSMLDVMPGGEMARGDSAAAERLLREKLEGDTGAPR